MHKLEYTNATFPQEVGEQDVTNSCIETETNIFWNA